MEIFDYVMKKARIPYKRVHVPGIPPQSYGKKMENGSWTGFLGAIQRVSFKIPRTDSQGLVDTYAGDFTLDRERIIAFNFTTPYSLEATIMLAPDRPKVRFL